MLNSLEMVQEFHAAFGLNQPRSLKIKLIEEELSEAEEALAAFIKEWADLSYVILGLVASFKADEEHQHPFELLSKDTDNRMAIIAMMVQGFPTELLSEAFKRVHESNMSKLGADGKPIFREDGKLLKGPDYKEPDILSLIVGDGE